MAQRITVTSVREATESLIKACQRLGMDTAKWQLQEGSSTYGRAYRLYDDGRGVLGLSQGYLGLTASEAHRAIEVMLGTLWALEEAGVTKKVS